MLNLISLLTAIIINPPRQILYLIAQNKSFGTLNAKQKTAAPYTAGYVGRFKAITCAVFDFSDSTSETLKKKKNLTVIMWHF